MIQTRQWSKWGARMFAALLFPQFDPSRHRIRTHRMIQHGGTAMTNWLIGYAAAGAVFLALDVLWLSFVATAVYRPVLRDILAADVHFGAAALFYVIYLAGVMALAVAPALQSGSLATACALGAVLGFVAYGTYDLTNAATLKIWPPSVVALDMAWGTALTAATSGAAYLAITAFGDRASG